MNHASLRLIPLLLISTAVAASDFQPVDCEGRYERHLQGVCVDDSAIYWCFTTDLVKTDTQGKVLQQVAVANHHGDLCHHDGKIYVAVNLGKFNRPAGQADSWVYVYDAQSLQEVARHEVQQVVHGAGGIAYHDGRFIVIGGLPEGVEENYLYEYDTQLRFQKRHVLPSGYTRLGIQTATFNDDRWWLGCYGSQLLVTDNQFNLIGKHAFNCALGIEALPEGRFFVASGSCDDDTGCTGSLRLADSDPEHQLHVIPGEGNGDQTAAAAPPLRVAVFQTDATPPLGTPVAYADARKIEDPLWARGIVLLGAGDPIVLCAVDWIGIGNGGHDLWRQQLAAAAKTSVDRVAVHVLHQHDGVRCDFTAEALAAAHGLGGRRFDVGFVRETIQRTAQAVGQSLAEARPVSHLGVGQAEVKKVASNRRILGPDGRVAIARSSSYRIPEPILSRLIKRARRDGYEQSAVRVEEAIEAPEGVIDPLLKMLTFFDQEEPLVSLSYYATHPQSYFGKGDVTSEFVGLARARWEDDRDGLKLVHFNGAGGNVAAGKYNDGSHRMRVELTKRMHDGMRRAWEATERRRLAAADVDWRVQPVSLPVNDKLDPDVLRATLEDPEAEQGGRLAAAGKLAFLSRMAAGHQIELACLQLGDVYVLHMPGELFIEYQLAAQQMRPDAVVCMAAYGDYGPGYIGTEIAYWQGGYETQPSASSVSPQVEGVLTEAMEKLLKPAEPR